MKRPCPPRSRGFSLLELLMVLSIMTVVATFVVPAVSTAIRGTPLTQASMQVTNQMSLARQLAITRNKPVEVRFLRYGDPSVPGEIATKPETGSFRALQLMEVLDSGSLVALGKVQSFPNPAVMNNAGLSTLLDGSRAAMLTAKDAVDRVDPPMPQGIGVKYQYISFRFLPNGATNLPPTPSEPWYVTLHIARDAGATSTAPPPNFFTLQVDPVSGTTRSFRPGLR